MTYSIDAAGPPAVHGRGAERGMAWWLSLAAAPTFAFMALLCALPDAGRAGLLCSMAPASPFGGMVPMYLLMSAFHSPPWLRLISGVERRHSRLIADAPMNPTRHPGPTSEGGVGTAR